MPKTPCSRIKMFPQVRYELVYFVVGIESFPCFHTEFSGRNISKVIHLLRFLWFRFFLLLLFLLLLLLWLGVLLGLLGFGMELLVPFVVENCHLLTKRKISEHRFEVGLIDASQEPSVYITKGFPELRVEHLSIQHQHIACHSNICQCNSLTNQKCSRFQESIQHGHAFLQMSLSFLCILLVVLLETQSWINPRTS